jgi:isopenicillin N synthase-like dioxygenase
LSNFRIPLVDFSKYLHGTPAEQKECVASIISGFTTSGFLYLTNSRLSPAEAYKWSEAFFALPVQEKNKHLNKDAAGNRGYSSIGLEKVSNADLENGKRCC